MIYLGGGKRDRKTSLTQTLACQGLPRSGAARMGRDNGNGAFTEDGGKPQQQGVVLIGS